MRVLEFVGINPAFVNKMYVEPFNTMLLKGLIIRRANSGKKQDAEQIRSARIYRRFYAACQLRDLCNEVPVHTVAHKFEIPRGFVQTLAQTCEGFAAGMVQFCDTLG